jgi:hypothetical protein
MSINQNITPTRIQALSQTADDTGVAAVIKCFGDPTIYKDPRIVLAAHGLTFYKDYANSVQETIVFQSGVTAGTINLGQGADNMAFLELANTITQSRVWGCTLVCARPEDIVYKYDATTPVDAVLGIAFGDANAKACATEAGTLLVFDTSADVGNGLHYDVCIGPEGLNETFATFAGRKSAPDTWNKGDNDAEDYRDASGNFIPGLTNRSMALVVAWVASITAASTYSSGTSAITVYAANQTDSSTVDSFASGATTVAKIQTYATELTGGSGRRLIVRLTNSAALSAASLSVQGGFGSLN